MLRLTGSLLLVVCLCSFASAELKPEQVAVIGNAKGKDSSALAQHYLKARGIPNENLLLVDMPTSEVLNRDTWSSKVRPEIRKWLLAENRSKKIRCLVTLWDVPLKIGPVDQSNGKAAEIGKALEGAQANGRESINQLAAQLTELANPGADKPEAFPATATIEQLSKGLDVPFQQAFARVSKLSSSEPNSARTTLAKQRIERAFVTGTGALGGLRTLEAQAQGKANIPAELRQALDMRNGEMNGLRQGIGHLSFLPESLERDQQLLAAIFQADGLLGVVQWSTQQAELWGKNETYSSLDNELGLILWNETAALRWLPNPLHYSQGDLPTSRPPTMMVARIDGPTIEHARRLIDDAIDIEQAGLTGRVYIDARGMTASKEPGSYGDYDQNLRDLATLLKRKTKLTVVVDDKDALFEKDGCPDVALYCGWYSLANYVDSFKWRRGSVGYHIASGEAATLKNDKSNVWCKRMLEEGVAATLGPTYEPYLTAFPRPNDFFPLLLTGQMTLGEVFAHTSPFQSWVMTFVGDPLYNPYKESPQIAIEDLPLPLQTLFPLR